MPQPGRPGRLAEHGDRAARDDLHAHDRAHQGRLAPTAGAEQADHLAPRHGDVEVGQHLAPAPNDPKVLDDDGIPIGLIRHVRKYAITRSSAARPRTVAAPR